ncbi:MAG: hypothetical protein V3V62_07545 [bacterium]
MSLSLIAALLVSGLIHLVLIVYGPEIRPPLASDKVDEFLPVDLVRRNVPLPEALRPKAPPPIPLPKALDLDSLLGAAAASASAPTPALSARAAPLRPKAAPKGRPLARAPVLNFPRPVLNLGEAALGRPEPGPDPMGVVALPPVRIGQGGGLGKRRDLLSDERTDALLRGEIAKLPAPGALARRRQAIRGPAARRRLVFRPPAPRVKELEGSADIEFRFWVLPDGTVGRVVPVRKGSAALEGIASNHLKRWRFSPLPPGAPRREEWGIISFRFRVR